MATVIGTVAVALAILAQVPQQVRAEDSAPVARGHLERLELADGSNLSIWTMVQSRTQKQTCKVRLVRHPKGSGGKEPVMWGLELTSVDYMPGTRNYYALVKVADDRIFIFCLWNGQHCIIDAKNGKVLNMGEGDDALKDHANLVPLKLKLGEPSRGRTMTEQERKELDKEDEERERARDAIRNIPPGEPVLHV